jgi:CheY-like chemotaxis protein
VHAEVTSQSGGRVKQARNGPRRCVLLVEDEYIQARHVSGILEEMGCGVIGPVASVHEALNLIRTELPDAALLDIKLEGQSVRTVAEHLDRMGIPVTLLSGYRPGDVPKAFRKYPLLGKPYTEGELRRAVERLLRNEVASPA